MDSASIKGTLAGFGGRRKVERTAIAAANASVMARPGDAVGPRMDRVGSQRETV